MVNNKKAIFQIDSIISLSLFLMFIVWVFIFVSNYQLPPSPSVSLLVPNLDNLKWSVNKLPLFAYSNLNGSYPVIITLPEGINLSYNHTLLTSCKKEIPFIMDSNRLIFFDNLSQKNIYYLINSGDNYKKSGFKQIIANESYVSTQEIRAELNNSILQNLSYNDKMLIYNFQIALNKRDLKFNKSSSLKSMGIYRVKANKGGINNTCYFFGMSNWVVCYVDSEERVNKNINFLIGLANFTEFYSDNSHYGFLNDSFITPLTSYNFSTDRIVFLDKNNNVSLWLMFNYSNISVSYINNSLFLNISSSFTNTFKYELFADNYVNLASEDNQIFPTISATFGTLQELTGLDPEVLTNKTYLTDFMRGIYSNSTRVGLAVNFNGSLIKTSTAPKKVNVYARELILPVLLNNASFSKAILTLRRW